MTQNSLTDKVKSAALTPAQGAIKTLAHLLEQNKAALAKAVPKHVDAERLARVALTVVRTTPTLLECSPESIMSGVMMSAQLGCELGLIGHAYLVPFNNTKTGRKEAQFIIGYRGMIDLARRSGNIESLKAECVYQNDIFRMTYGLEDKLEHVPYHCREDKAFEESGTLKGVYAVAKLKGGGHQILYMTKGQVDDRRKRAKASQYGPWVTDYVQMALKTVVRSLFKWLPISVELARAVESNDESIKVQIADDMADVPSTDTPDVLAQEAEFSRAQETKSPEVPAHILEVKKLNPKVLAKARSDCGITTDTDKLTMDEASQILAEVLSANSAGA